MTLNVSWLVTHDSAPFFQYTLHTKFNFIVFILRLYLEWFDSRVCRCDYECAVGGSVPSSEGVSLGESIKIRGKALIIQREFGTKTAFNNAWNRVKRNVYWLSGTDIEMMEVYLWLVLHSIEKIGAIEACTPHQNKIYWTTIHSILGTTVIWRLLYIPISLLYQLL